jgi:hypothetical protein
MLTATSAGEGCSGRRVRAIFDDVKGVVEGIDGVTLESESHVGVDAGGDADVGVAEEFLDHHEVDTLLQERGSSAPPPPTSN